MGNSARRHQSAREFSVLDDWAYYASVKALVEHGQLVFSNWTATNLISQIAWGAMFAIAFGTSYTVLRFSTLVLALLGTGALYLTLRETQCGRGTALLGSLLFLFNPVVWVMSASFMSDVPYTAMQTIAMLWLIRAFRSGSTLTFGRDGAFRCLPCCAGRSVWPFRSDLVPPK